MFDLVVILSAILACISGLATMHAHRRFFAEFTVEDLMDIRADALLFVILMGSTALSFWSALLRVLWWWRVGWATSGTSWQFLWLSRYFGEALLFTGLHVLIWVLLQRPEFKRLCQTHYRDPPKSH